MLYEIYIVAGKPIWLCAKKAKHANKKAVYCSLYKGTLFEDSKASPKKIVELLYCFSLKLTYVQTSKQTDLLLNHEGQGECVHGAGQRNC